MGRLRESLKLATRNVARNLRRSLFTGTMIALGIASIAFFKAYIVGLQGMILDMAIDGRHGALQVQREGYAAAQELAPLDLDLPGSGDLEARIRGAAGVRAVAPRLGFVGLLSNGETSTNFVGLAIDPGRERQVCPLGPGANHVARGAGGEGYGLLAGAGLQRVDEEAIVIAGGLAAGLKVKVGGTVTLLAQTRGGSLDAVDLTVAGIYRFEDPLENKHFLVVPLRVAQKLLHLPDRVTAFAVGVHGRDRIPAGAATLRAALAGADPRTEVRTWSDLSPYYRDVIKLQDQVLNVVMVVVFALVLAGVINTMMMSVFERRREIGTLMALGFRRVQILWLFLLEALVLGLISSAGGVALGIGVIALTRRVGIAFEIPAVGAVVNRPELSVAYLALAVGAALLGALAAGLYPAYRASRLRPVEALRTD